MSGAGYFRSDRSFLNMPFKGFLHQLPLCDGPGIPPIARHGFRTVAISILILGSLQLSAVRSQPPESNSTITEEPITPIPELAPIDPGKVKLGERLFGDPRLSHDNSRSCYDVIKIMGDSACEGTYGLHPAVSEKRRAALQP